MANDILSDGLVFLIIISICILVATFAFNFTLLVTSLKLRRIERTDKSNYFLTHLLASDFVCSFFILIPSAYGIYNFSKLDSQWCHVQIYFSTLSTLITFHGLFALSCERYLKYSRPDTHIAYFSTEAQPSCLPACGRVSGFLLLLWIIDIFFAFIPLFGNSQDQTYYVQESQCDYKFEKFQWWLWFYFILGIVVPFVASLSIFSVTIQFINKYKQKVIKNKAKNELGFERKKKNINKVKEDSNSLSVYGVHRVVGKFSEDNADSAFAKKIILNQFKYKTDKQKTITFFIITLISFLLHLPLFVLHFYRAYNNLNRIPWQLYTSLVWISYCSLFIKPLVCITTNPYYRKSIRQAVHKRGFHGDFKNYKNEEALRKERDKC